MSRNTPGVAEVQKARRVAKQYYDKHKHDDEWRGHHPSHLASAAIKHAGEVCKIGFGPEGFCWDCGRDGLTYLNMGDTYDLTVLFDTRTCHFTVGNYGDFVERLERDGITLD